MISFVFIDKNIQNSSSLWKFVAGLVVVLLTRIGWIGYRFGTSTLEIPNHSSRTAHDFTCSKLIGYLWFVEYWNHLNLG